MVYPQQDTYYKIVKSLNLTMLIACVIVARVQPRTSKGITDLL